MTLFEMLADVWTLVDGKKNGLKVGKPGKRAPPKELYRRLRLQGMRYWLIV